MSLLLIFEIDYCQLLRVLAFLFEDKFEAFLFCHAAARSVISGAALPAHSAHRAKLKKFRYGQILKATDKSPYHSTDWPLSKVRSLLVVSKTCILAYIECRTLKFRQRNSSNVYYVQFQQQYVLKFMKLKPNTSACLNLNNIGIIYPTRTIITRS